MTFDEALPVAHLAATWFMVGLIWFVQVVHYPLLAQVGDGGFASYASSHRRRTSVVVVPAMLLEATTAALLVVRPVTGLPAPIAWAGLALLLAIWASTFLIQVPCHARLARGFDPIVHRRLVRSNLLRTALWSVRGLLALTLI